MSFKSYLSTLRLIHLVLIIGQLFFAVIVFLLVYSGEEEKGAEHSLSSTFMIAIPALIVAALAIAVFIFNSRLKQVRQRNDLRSKLADYRMLLILRFALIEGPSLFAIIATLVTGNLSFLVFAGGIIILFMIWQPTRARLIGDLQLTGQDLYVLEGDDFRL